MTVSPQAFYPKLSYYNGWHLLHKCGVERIVDSARGISVYENISQKNQTIAYNFGCFAYPGNTDILVKGKFSHFDSNGDT